MLDVDVDDARKGRVVELLTLCEFFRIVSGVVVVGNVSDNRVVGLGGLNVDRSLLVLTSGATLHLFHHVESAFVRAKVGEVDNVVGI